MKKMTGKREDAQWSLRPNAENLRARKKNIANKKREKKKNHTQRAPTANTTKTN